MDVDDPMDFFVAQTTTTSSSSSSEAPTEAFRRPPCKKFDNAGTYYRYTHRAWLIDLIPEAGDLSWSEIKATYANDERVPWRTWEKEYEKEDAQYKAKEAEWRKNYPEYAAEWDAQIELRKHKGDQKRRKTQAHAAPVIEEKANDDEATRELIREHKGLRAEFQQMHDAVLAKLEDVRSSFDLLSARALARIDDSRSGPRARGKGKKRTLSEVD